MSTARALRPVVAPVSDEPLKTLAEVAAYLGISIQTLYAFRKHGRGPRGYRIGGRVQFRLSEVDAWVQQQRESAPNEAPPQNVRAVPAGEQRGSVSSSAGHPSPVGELTTPSPKK